MISVATTRTPPPAPGVRVSPEELYWAVLKLPSGSPRLVRGESGRQLGYLFETSLPVPIESVHARYTPLGGGRVLACGIDRDKLGSHSEQGLSLKPAALPRFVRAELEAMSSTLPEAGRINLLTGPYTPRSVRRLQSRWLMVALVGMLVCSVLLVVGFERRRAGYVAQAERHRQVSSDLYSQALGPSTGNGQHPSAQLLAELRSLRQRTSTDARREGPSDASLALAALLDAWPQNVASRTESLAVRNETIRLSVRIDDPQAAEQFEARLSGLDGWSLGQRSLRRSRDGLTLQLPLARTRGSQP